jgi:hypothetical protein
MTEFLGWCWRWAFHPAGVPAVGVPCVEVGGRVTCCWCAAAESGRAE